MTCALSMPMFYQNQYSENVPTFKYLDFNWMMSGCYQLGFVENQISSGNNDVDTNKDSTKTCPLEPSDEISGKVTYSQTNVLLQKIKGSKLNTIFSDRQIPADDNKESSRCIGTHTRQGEHKLIKAGVKRNADIKYCDDIYIPSKRISPFLNIPKERRDEKRSILRMCMRKIEKLEDPESFLRRSVLVNNLTKRLQTELREDKHISGKFSSYRKKHIDDYKVLNNNCLSDIYLCDDLFLSGPYEAITDDMTETLINNVLSDYK